MLRLAWLGLVLVGACSSSHVSERDVGAEDATIVEPIDGGMLAPPDAGPIEWPVGGGVPTVCGAADGTWLRSETPGSFGWSVAVTPDGSRAIVGAISDGAVGAAYVFRCEAGAWTREARLTGMGIVESAELGRSVALSDDGSIAVVGAPFDYSEPDRSDGSARVFARTGTSWSEEARLFPAGSTYGSWVGYAVDVSADGTVALVGRANHDTRASESQGSAHVYRRGAAGWVEEAELLADPPGYQAAFGAAVALSADGDVALVSAPGDDTEGMNDDRGSARVFRRVGGAWSAGALLVAGDPMDWFGTSVALSADGTRAAVGCAYDDEGGENTGSVRVFSLEGGVSREEAVLVPPSTIGTGTALALSADGRVLVVSSDVEGTLSAGPGRVHVFVRAGTTWRWAGTHVGETSASFGFSTAITADGSYALVGALGLDFGPDEVPSTVTWLRLAP